MGEKYRFFDSIEGEDERFYTADEFAEYFRQFIRNGIFNGGENLKVVTDEKDMKISIKPGYAWIEGYLYKITGEDLILEHNIADPSLNRIDRVVIRLDKTLENRYVKAFILEGTPEEAPKAPSLTRDDNIYEISLAQVEIIAGKSFIESYQITDERLETEVCGIATHLFEQVDTTDIFNEWQKYLIHKRNESDVSYEEFVTAYQNTWNSWIEDKISEPSGEFYAEWKVWFNEVQDTTNLVTKSQFDDLRRNTSITESSKSAIRETSFMSAKYLAWTEMFLSRDDVGAETLRYLFGIKETAEQIINDPDFMKFIIEAEEHREKIVGFLDRRRSPEYGLFNYGFLNNPMKEAIAFVEMFLSDYEEGKEILNYSLSLDVMAKELSINQYAMEVILNMEENNILKNYESNDRYYYSQREVDDKIGKLQVQIDNLK